MVDVDKRAQISSLTCIVWALGLGILPLSIYLTRDWVYFNLISSITALILLGLST